jgi:hypothetical protein
MITTRVEFEVHAASLSAFQAGFNDGRAASLRKERLTPYLRVGLDEYAQGYRSGFFTRTSAPSAAPGSDSPLSAATTSTRAFAQR